MDNDAPIIDFVSETFQPSGVHDLRPVPTGGSLADEVVAPGVREVPEPDGYRTPRWGGRLLNARAPAA